jgi:Tol biopolymer transport system component
MGFIFIIALFAACYRGPTDEPVEVTTWDAVPSWSHGGDRLTLASYGDLQDSIPIIGLYIVDTTGENRVLLSPGGSYSTWLPGDTAIIFMKIDFKLYYLNLTTMQESLLCDCIDSRFPEMSPDGKSVYYEDQGVANNWATSIYRMDLATGDTTHIVGGTFPSISPDGRYLLISRHKVYRYDLVTDSEIVIFSLALAAHYDWSPDGQNVLIGNVIHEPELSNKIYKVNADGTGAHYFTQGKYPKYSPDGGRIAIVRVSSDMKEHVWLINADGSDAKQLTF